jgi:hypothetical protein
MNDVTTVTTNLVFLGIGELRKRWNYTRQAINIRIKEDKCFPKPYAIVNDGKTKVWLLNDVITYEVARPNLLRRQENNNFKVYCRTLSEYNLLTEKEKKAIASNNPYSKLA